MKLNNQPVNLCTAHEGVAVIYRTATCPMCKFLRELEDLEAKAKLHEDQIAELKLVVEDLRADYGEIKKGEVKKSKNIM